ncbi:MAG: protein-L-isoaspartate O-methyltransferase [Xanthomonadales bacterium]|nr:protein-L-isoaspartate O-methyltransferase [Xanthomonadales bacterium]NNL94266.1 protein-L-isoaspartate O-methyltransferase [Xanthomonadales bacterium]
MNFDHARYNMVEQQVRTWEVIDDRVLRLLETIEREDFVPVRYRKLAFADLNIPLAHDQVMMKPNVEGRMLQALDLQPDETALEIGTGSGFITACLARLARHVVSVEIFDDLAKSAKRTLKDKEVHNLDLFVGDALSDWQPEQAHDVLLVTGSVETVPEHFKGWVNPGGRMFIVDGHAPAMSARLLTRVNASEWREESLFETDLPRLVNAEQPPQFEF